MGKLGRTGPKRTRHQLLADRRIIAEKLAEGETIRQIAPLFPLVTYQQVQFDIRAIRKMWLQEISGDYDGMVANHVAEIRHLKGTYWRAWYASLQEKTQTSTSQDVLGEAPTKRRATLRREVSTGNPAFLSGVQWCLEAEARILGINTQERLEQLLEQETREMATEFGLPVDELKGELEKYLSTHIA